MVRFSSRDSGQIRYNIGVVNFCNKFRGAASLDSLERKTWFRNLVEYCVDRNCYSGRRHGISGTRFISLGNHLLSHRNRDGRDRIKFVYNLWIRARATGRVDDGVEQENRCSNWSSSIGY